MNKKILFGLAAALSVIIVGIVFYSSGKSENQSTRSSAYPPVKVALAYVERSIVPRTFSGVGELEAIRQVQVAAESGGRVIRIAFDSGQTVEEGQLLVQLNDAVEQAELARLQAKLRNVESIHARAHQLAPRKIVSQEYLDNAIAERDMTRSEIAKTQALIAQKAIHAPFSGMIGIRRVHEGQYLTVADPIANLIDADTLRSNFSLDERTSPELSIGQLVEVQVDAYPGHSFPARVTAIDPLIGKSRTIQVQATLTNPDGMLKAGMYTNIQVSRQDNSPVLTVPETAVTYTAYGDTVFIIQPGDEQTLITRRVAVKVGQRLDGRVEIETGLREGERVITSGQLKLSDGMTVEAVAEDTLSATPQPKPATDS